MGELSKEEYRQDLFELYRKSYYAVNKWLEYHLDMTREQTIKSILDEAFGGGPNNELSPVRQILRSNLELFFAKNMTVDAVEKLLIKK
jgi:hypothetical protein